MEIEIVAVGESSRWVLNQPYVRIGQDPSCEVSLGGGRYPSVAGEHVTLDLAAGAVRLIKGSQPGVETFLNGHPASEGAALRSGDVLRLGAGGPELRIRLLEQEARTLSHEPTRVLYQPAPQSHEATRMIQSHEATRVISAPEAASFSPEAGAPARHSYTTPSTQTVASAPYTSAAAQRRMETVVSGAGTQVNYGQARPRENAAQLTSRPAEGGNMQTLENKLNAMRLLLIANLALVALLFVWIFLQGQELSRTHNDLQALRAQSQTAIGQFTPQLDQRLSAFDQRMDAMDAKIAAAQDRMVKGMDAQEKLAEDHLVERMKTEIPGILNSSIAKMRTDMAQHYPALFMNT